MNNARLTNAGARGMSFSTGLGLLFIFLKLTGIIPWPWILVLMPLWIPLAAIATMFLVVGIIWGILTLIAWRKK